MSQPNPLYDEDSVCCEYWNEVDGDDGHSHEWCDALVLKNNTKARYGQCSCSGCKSECNNGMFTPQIRDDDYERDVTKRLIERRLYGRREEPNHYFTSRYISSKDRKSVRQGRAEKSKWEDVGYEIRRITEDYLQEQQG